MIVRCLCCHREERWSEAGVREAILQEGGRRRPAEHPALAGWRVLLAAHRGETGPAVGSCSACGQPMVGEAGAPGVASFTLRTPAGDVVVATRGIATPKGPMSWEEADSFVQSAVVVREPRRPLLFVWEVFVVTLGSVPFLMWIVAMMIVGWLFVSVSNGTIGY